MLARLFAVVLLVALAAPLAAAAPPASPSFLPQTPKWVYAEFSLTEPNLTLINVGADLYIYHYTINGKEYDADDLGHAFVATNQFAGEASGEQFVAQIESAVRDATAASLVGSFPGASIADVIATVDRTTLVEKSGNPYDPPVKVHVTTSVQRSRADAGLGSLSDAAIAAAFASGAKVTTDFTLKADTGEHFVYSIGAPAVPSGLKFQGSGVSTDGSTLSADLDNTGGSRPSVAVSAKLMDPAATAPTAEDIRSAIDVKMGDLAKGATGIPIDVTVAAQVRSLDVSKRFPGVLSGKVSLPFVNAQGVRALHAAGAIKDADISKANDALLTTIKDDVSRAFGPGATVTGGLDAADLNAAATKPYGVEPPLKFGADAKTTYVVKDATADDIDLALRIGGTASVDLNLFPANGRDTTYTIHPLSIAEFTGAKGGSVAADHSAATFNVPAGASTYPATLSLRGKGVPTLTATDAGVNVTVDLKDLDVSIGKAVGGDLGNLQMEITVTGNLGVIQVPDSLKGSLPSNLELQYLSSDAIRLLVDKGKISQENLTKLDSDLLKQVKEKLGTALGGDIPVTGGLDRATLAVSLVSTPISSEKPIQFKATARVIKPVSGGPVQPQAAIALYTTSLPLKLPKLQDYATQYTVILPKGLAVKDVSTTGGTSKTGTAPDGRDQFTVTPTSDNAQVTVAMAVTPTFVMAKFWPVVLLAVILLVLIVGTPIALVVRARGKKKAAAGKK